MAQSIQAGLHTCELMTFMVIVFGMIFIFIRVSHKKCQYLIYLEHFKLKKLLMVLPNRLIKVNTNHKHFIMLDNYFECIF